MIRGAFAAALTPLRDGGTALDEAVFEPVRRTSSPTAGSTGSSRSGRRARGSLLSQRGAARGRSSSSSRPPRGRLAVAVHCGAQTTAETAALAAHAAEAGADAVAVIAPPFFPLDAPALEEHFAAAAAACAPLPFYVYEFAARSGYAVPDRGDRAAARAGAEPARAQGLGQAVGEGRAVPARRTRHLRRRRGARRPRPRRRRGRCRLGPRRRCSRRSSPALVREPTQERSDEAERLRAALDRFPFQAAAKAVAARRGVPIRADVRPPLRTLTAGELERARAAVILVAGAGAIGAGIAYRLALRGARDVVLCDRGEIGSGSTSRAMGGVRQQFSTAAEVRLAQESIAFFAELGPPFFHQVGYLFLADDRGRPRRARGAAASCRPPSVSRSSGSTRRSSPVSRPATCSAPCSAQRTASPTRRRSPHELVRRARELGVEVREHTLAESLLDNADTLVIACGPWSAALGCACRRRAARAAALPAAARDRAAAVAASECCRWWSRQRPASTSAAAATGWCSRWPTPSHAGASRRPSTSRSSPTGSHRLVRRFPPAAGCRIDEAWAGLYDMTPDAHPILGRVADGVYAACGFSGHGFMQSPAVAHGDRRGDPRRRGVDSTSRPTASNASQATSASLRPLSSSEPDSAGACASTSTRSPPVPVIAGAAVSHDDLTLEAADGNRFAAFAAVPDEPSAPGSSSCRTCAGSTASTRSWRSASPSAATRPSRSTTSAARRAWASATTTSRTWITSPRRRPEGSRPTSRAAVAYLRGNGASLGVHRRLLLRRPPLVARRRPAATAWRARSASTACRPSETACRARPSSAAEIDSADPRAPGRRRPEHHRGAQRRVRRGAHRRRRRARDRHLPGRTAQLLRPQVRRVRGGIRRCLGARARLRRPLQLSRLYVWNGFRTSSALAS